MNAIRSVICPFCGFKGHDEYKIQLHIEQQHTDDSPFLSENDLHSKPTPASTKSDQSAGNHGMPTDTWTKCTRPACGDFVLLADIDEHLEMHAAIAMVDKECSSTEGPPQCKAQSQNRYPEFCEIKQRHKLQKPSKTSNGTVLSYLSGTPSTISSRAPTRSTIWDRRGRRDGRLGRRELGPYAWEKAMPAKVRQTLEQASLPRHVNRIGPDGRLIKQTVVENETAGLVPVLADLCALDGSTEVAYFCHPSVKHIFKIACQGNFCGYWNIQVLLTYILRDDGGVVRLPNVLQIQDIIEAAWSKGVCSYGQVETGGVRNTRKWIGSHEAAAYLLQTGVPVDALSFTPDEQTGTPAHEALLDYVEAYFLSGAESTRTIHGNAQVTQLPPIYLQRFGHSMTIVGLERRVGSMRNLLVFDSSFAPSRAMRKLVAGGKIASRPEELLRVYRKDEEDLRRFKEFEVVGPQTSRRDVRAQMLLKRI